SIAITVVLLFLSAAATFVVPRSRAHAQQPPQPAQSVPALRVAVQDGSKITNYGQTYHFLEAKAARVTTRYQDASAVAERGADGSLKSHLRDAAGSDISQLGVDGDPSGTSRIEFSSADIRMFTQPRSEVKPTLDWTNQQAYALWKDKTTAAA